MSADELRYVLKELMSDPATPTKAWMKCRTILYKLQQTEKSVLRGGTLAAIAEQEGRTREARTMRNLAATQLEEDLQTYEKQLREFWSPETGIKK